MDIKYKNPAYLRNGVSVALAAFTHRRIVLPMEGAQNLPIIVESVGVNPEQEKVERIDGYSCFHWLQTNAGEGVIRFEGRTVHLPCESGILLFPGVPHSYVAADESWESSYLTFGGPAAHGMLVSLGIHASSVFRWFPDSPIGRFVADIVSLLEQESDLFGIEASSAAYRFLVTLSRHKTEDGRRAGLSRRLDKLRKVVDWMESHYANPDIGIEEIASVLELSNRRLTGLFQEAFGLSPYAYFIQLRLRKAKEKLVSSPTLTIREIAQRVGFRDASHFVATFRKHAGMTPEQFRNYH